MHYVIITGCVCVCVKHILMLSCTLFKTRHCQKLLLPSRHNQTSCHPVFSKRCRHCQHSCRSFIFSSSHYAQWKVIFPKCMKHVYKPNRAAVITHQREDTTVCASSCSSPFTSVRWLCMQTQHWRSVHRSKCLVVNGLKRDTSWPLCLFTRREIRRSSVLSSLWSEAAIATDYSKRVRLKKRKQQQKLRHYNCVI